VAVRAAVAPAARRVVPPQVVRAALAQAALRKVRPPQPVALPHVEVAPARRAADSVVVGSAADSAAPPSMACRWSSHLGIASPPTT